MPRLHQADGAVLRRQLPHHQEPTESHRRAAALRPDRSRAGRGSSVDEGSARAAAARRRERGRRDSATPQNRGQQMTTHTDDTKQILEMVAQGKITVDEADRLLRALGEARSAETTAAAPGEAADARRPRWLRINIVKPADEHRPHPREVNIRVPLGVVRGGMRLGAIIATFAGEKAVRRMKVNGLDLDLEAINGDLSKLHGPEFDAFLNSLHDIDIDDGKSRVRITSE